MAKVSENAFEAMHNVQLDLILHLLTQSFGSKIQFIRWQAEQAQHIYIENEKKLEEMLDGIEKLFGYVVLVTFCNVEAIEMHILRFFLHFVFEF